MNEPLDEHLEKYYEQFARDHDRLRSELLASLPESPAGARPREGRAAGPSLGQKGRTARRLLKVAAVVAGVAAVAGLLLWLRPGPAAAGVVFADVLRQIREAQTVIYNSTLELGDLPPRTSKVMCKEPGQERKVAPTGQVQVSDFTGGRILYVEPQHKWALSIEYAVTQEEGFKPGPLQRLKTLGGESGTFVGEEELAGRPVHVFEVRDESDQMTIWADSKTGLPVRVQILTSPKKDGQGVTTPGATLTLSDFIWNEELDDALFELEAPKGFERYEIELIDNSRPVDEEDLLEAFRILTDLSDGAFPDSLFAKDIMPVLEKLDFPAAALIGRKTPYAMLAGPPMPSRPGEPPPMVKYLRAAQKRRQVARGIKFVDQLTFAKRRWGYGGKGVRRGQEKAVFWYQPEAADTRRVIYGNLTTREVSPEKPRGGPGQPDRGAVQPGEAA